MRSHSPRSFSEPIRPFPLVPVEARRHILGDPVRTRLGVGEVSIDHAAGLPLVARSSRPAARDRAVQPRSRSWSETPNPAPMPRYGFTHPDDSPVDLPLRSVSRMVLVGVAVLVAFIAVVLGVFFAGFSRTILVTDVGASEAAPVRGERVLVTTPKDTHAQSASTASPTVSSRMPNAH
jgi:hypothetical protein